MDSLRCASGVTLGLLGLPSQLLLFLGTLWVALGVAASFRPWLFLVWKGLGLSMGLAALADWILVVWPKPLLAQRELGASLALGVWKKIGLRLENHSRWPWWVKFIDHAPGDFHCHGELQQQRLPANGFLETHYTVCPTARGERLFKGLQVRIRSPLRLWYSNRMLECHSTTKVFPDFAALARYALLATDNRLSTLGILRKARRGEGMDFHQLREYRMGDSLRAIDWKATAKYQKLISREYQDERDQQVVFLLDCGRRMRDLDALQEADPNNIRVSHFDQALNAMFLLAFVALKEGDAVGVGTFAETEPRMIAPRKGMGTINHLFNELFDLQSTTLASDYLEAAQALRLRLRKRSLIVILSNVRDEEEDTLQQALALLRHKHLVVFANLREVAIDRILGNNPGEAPPGRAFDTALLQAGALDWTARRETLLKGLTKNGIRLVDVPPDQLSIALVNRYLEMKAAGEF